ncbi:3,4-dihydroxy-2-butanone-4-phosphate synthase [Saccharopolyspora sp. K220]|uniref:3,4-dihydroxy-2-butanone-4-phosphate synthase n=1 Tax=Saccharopolyspora soli TaxID=2926618 RepID=UPI001F57CF34|nr:3,4-dihydroxy-2-butanone-4-phosphate synthase [Saccharopolyspora soli]MCI2422446.1 3,4-dihydroxy-2-butanone-4-phosphate synthase [Saccharopolyspora soli]
MQGPGSRADVDGGAAWVRGQAEVFEGDELIDQRDAALLDVGRPGEIGLIDLAVQEIAAGRAAVVHGFAHGDGGIVFAASRASTELTAFTVRHSSGFLCVALPRQRCDELALPPIFPRAQESPAATACVTVDASMGVSTGISASDRARTARLLAAPEAVPADFTRPGHVVPVAVGDGGVLDNAGLAEAAADLAVLAGSAPVAVFAHLVSPADATRMATDDELRRFAAAQHIASVGVAEIEAARRSARWDGRTAG